MLGLFKKFPYFQQSDSMDCGPSCLAMVIKYYGKNPNIENLRNYCALGKEGVSLLGIRKAAEIIGFKTVGGRISFETLVSKALLPCIVHWNQNHFVVVYNIKEDRQNRYTIFVSDPSKGHIKYSHNDFCKHWISSKSQGEEKGVALFLEPTSFFLKNNTENGKKRRSFYFLLEYFIVYRKYFFQIFLGLLLGCILQLIMPFLTQGIVDFGIANNDIGLVWIILLGELMIVIAHTATDFIRRWLLLHISMRINISLVSDFFIKLVKLPMSFFDTKLMGDLLQRMGDHNRVQTFLTTQVLSTTFSLLNFVVFGFVLLIYDKIIFSVFLLGSIFYGIWIALFLRRRKVLDYELFEQQAINQNKTYQFITTIQEIKLQDCEQRRRWEWEDVQADLFKIHMKSLKLQQTQEAGSIFINEFKNILITVLAATAVINSQITLGSMLAIQYIVGQLNSPIEQLMSFIHSLQDVKISLERISEIHEGKNEEYKVNQAKAFDSEKNINIDNIDFKYDPHALRKTLEDVSFNIPAGKVTAIVGASGSGKTTLIKLMLGYYPVLSGRISIAGRDINEYNLKWWRRHCGVVMQDGVIFSESIARNIAVDDGEVDVERLEQAARIANIYDYRFYRN